MSYNLKHWRNVKMSKAYVTWKRTTSGRVNQSVTYKDGVAVTAKQKAESLAEHLQKDGMIVIAIVETK